MDSPPVSTEHPETPVTEETEETLETSEVVIGSNAQENWNIIEKSDPGHVWFHLNSFPSPHVIIRSENPGDEEIVAAAYLCKSKSKYKNIKNVKVVYTRVANIELSDTVGAVNILSKRKCKYIIPE